MNIFEFYPLLGCHAGSQDGDIKSAHRRLSQSSHPDRNNGDTQLFLDVQQAYTATKTARDRRILADKLSVYGTPCPVCDGKGYRRKMKKFVATVISCCDQCRGNGYIQRNSDG